MTKEDKVNGHRLVGSLIKILSTLVALESSEHKISFPSLQTLVLDFMSLLSRVFHNHVLSLVSRPYILPLESPCELPHTLNSLCFISI